jgi:hypothetical protein
LALACYSLPERQDDEHPDDDSEADEGHNDEEEKTQGDEKELRRAKCVVFHKEGNTTNV